MRSRGWGKLHVVVSCLLTILACTPDRSLQPSHADTKAWTTRGQASIVTSAGLQLDTGIVRPIQLRLVKDVAIALRNPVIRQLVYVLINASTFPEHKVHFGSLVRGAGGLLLTAMSTVDGRSQAAVLTSLDSLPDFEMYLPVPEHFAAWRGDANLLVASELSDGETPVVVDLQGRVVLGIGSDVPPQTPTLVLVPVETDFSVAPAPGGVNQAECVECPPPCQGSACGGGGGSQPPRNVIRLFGVEIGDDHEGWLNGSPEFEMWVFAGDAGGNPIVGQPIYDPSNPATSQFPANTISYIVAGGCIGYFATGTRHWGYQAINTWRTYGSPPPIFANGSVQFDTLNFWLMVTENDDDGHCESNGGGWFPSVGNPNPFPLANDDDMVGRRNFPGGHLAAWHVPHTGDVDSIYVTFVP